MRTITVEGEIIDMAKVLTKEIVKSGAGVLKSILSGEEFSFDYDDYRISVKIHGEWKITTTTKHIEA